MLYSIELPIPPSVNALYGQRPGKKRFKSAKYKAWEASLPDIKPVGIEGPVRICYVLHFPDNRRRDISNFIKASEDFLVSSGVLVDDNHTVVPHVEIIAGEINKEYPHCVIEIHSLPD